MNRSDKHLYLVWPRVMAALKEYDKARVGAYVLPCAIHPLSHATKLGMPLRPAAHLPPLLLPFILVRRTREARGSQPPAPLWLRSRCQTRAA